MIKKGNELIFISRIKRDGSGVSKVFKTHVEFIKDDAFKLNSLSKSCETYIAVGFNSYVVKLKPQNNGTDAN